MIDAAPETTRGTAPPSDDDGRSLPVDRVPTRLPSAAGVRSAIDPRESFGVRFGRWADARRHTPAHDPGAFVFLDKDGTLIEDLPYNVDPRRVRLVLNGAEAIRLLGEAALPLAICSNQSGVARGYYTLDELERLARHLRGEVEASGGELAAMYACPHLPTASGPWALVCECRKPATGLLRRAADELGADLRASWMIGDTWMDVAAGKSAGCRAILVGPEWRTASSLPPARQPDAAVPDLLSAARIIVDDLRTTVGGDR